MTSKDGLEDETSVKEQSLEELTFTREFPSSMCSGSGQAEPHVLVSGSDTGSYTTRCVLFSSDTDVEEDLDHFSLMMSSAGNELPCSSFFYNGLSLAYYFPCSFELFSDTGTVGQVEAGTIAEAVNAGRIYNYSEMLTDKDFFLKITIQKSSFDIHLVDDHVLGSSIGNEYSDGLYPCNWSKRFLQNQYFLLTIIPLPLTELLTRLCERMKTSVNDLGMSFVKGSSAILDVGLMMNIRCEDEYYRRAS
ncbi:hypothetical protein Tco_0571691 [Tanacetum coccineum]